MAVGISPRQNPVLTSWKEIASYLGKGVRTVQRWESRFGLPVRRPNKKSKGVVYASRSELDRWLATHWSQRARGLEIPEPPNSAKAGKADVEDHREFCSECRQRIGELRRDLQILAERCQTLSQQITRLQTLLLQPVPPPLADQSTPPKKLLPKPLSHLESPVRLLDFFSGTHGNR